MNPFVQNSSELQRLQSAQSHGSLNEGTMEERESSIESLTRRHSTPSSPIPFCFNVYDILDLSTLLVLLGVILGVKSIHPFERPFDPSDKDLQHLIAPNIVSDPLLYFIAIGVPLISAILIRFIYLLLTPISQRSQFLRETLFELWAFTAGLLFTILITGLFTETVKNWIGRLRPDFSARCQYDEKLRVCTNPVAAVLVSGRRSFPSGHSSLSFSGCVYLALWMGHLVIQPLRNESPHRSLPGGTLMTKYALAALPLLLCTWVGSTRVQQNVHHPTDVIAGALLGTSIAVFSFIFYFKEKIKSSEWV